MPQIAKANIYSHSNISRKASGKVIRRIFRKQLKRKQINPNTIQQQDSWIFSINK